MVDWGSFKEKIRFSENKSISNLKLKNDEISVAFDPERLIRAHIKRLYDNYPNNTASHWTHDFCENVFTEYIETISSLAREKMDIAISDGKRHSSAIFNKDLCIHISVFPHSILKSRQNYYTTGYLDYLNIALRNARQENGECHFMHFQFFFDRPDYLFEFTFFPNCNILSFKPIYIMPTDLLTDIERKKLQLNEIN